jgi:metal-sulfur cluster biosynthetic enzyme
MIATLEQIQNKLSEVMDPELNIAITDLGLIYEVTQPTPEKVTIKMTLTTLGCPLFETIEFDIKNKIGELGYTDDTIKIELTFDPPWSMERMSERAKAMLGI